MSEKIPNTPKSGELMERITKLQEEKFGDLWEAASEFVPILRAEVEHEFPDEPKAWKMVPAYHAISGSTMDVNANRTISQEAKRFIEARISDFLTTLE